MRKNDNDSGIRRTHLGLVLIVLLGTATRLFRLGYQSLWYDEAFAWTVSSAPLDLSLYAILVDGSHPPLYYLLERLFPYLGSSETIVRLSSAIFGILCIPLAYKVASLCLGRRVGFFGALLLALSPFHVWFSQEARMYTMANFFILGGAYFFLRLLKESGSWGLWIGLTLCTILGYWANFSVFLFTLVQFAFLIITLRAHYPLLRRWTVAQGIAGLTILPWFVALYSRELNSFGFRWIPRPELSDIYKTLWNFSMGYTGLLTPLTILALLLFVVALALSFRDKAALFFHLWLWLPILFSWAISMRLSIYIDRFLMVSLPPFLILIAYGAIGVKKAAGRWALACGVLAATVVSLGQVYFDPVYYLKEDWRGMVQYIQENEQPGDVIVLPFFESLLPFNYYYTGEVEREPISTNRVTTPLETIAQGHSRLWLVHPHQHDSRHLLARSGSIDTTLRDQNPEIDAWLKSHEGQIVDRKSFSGLTIELYDLSS